MDPLTQGALGAAMAQATPTKTKSVGVAGALGFFAGVAADIDAVLRSPSDPLFYLEYHRHFTHALTFIPMGALLCALIVYYLFKHRWQLTLSQTFICCALGYGTHGLLDAATSYGTALLWPLSDVRVSWSFVPIVDPLFTLPLVCLIMAAALRNARMFAWAAMTWSVVYLSMGALQHHGAQLMAERIAEARGHTPDNLTVKPSFANILVWKTIYEAEGYFYVDAVRVGIRPRVYHGTSIAKLEVGRDIPWLVQNTQQAEDVRRFDTFSKGYIAVDPQNANRIIDIRYSFVPNEVRPLWSIELSPNAKSDVHATYQSDREGAREGFRRLLQMLFD